MGRFCFAMMLAALPALGGEVRFERKGEGYELLRDSKPYAIRGAGGTQRLEQLAEAGGNAIRTWSPPGRKVMDEAQRLGLSVLLGLPVGLPRQGFSYTDQAAVARQRDRIRGLVREYRDHPALLMYALGNEVEHHATAEQRLQVWREMEELARIVKQEDPRHPVITVTAGWGQSTLKELRELAPSLDAVGINTYGGMMRVADAVREQGWTKPWMVTEFGPRGDWEVPKTPWGLPVEDPSSAKADFYLAAYRRAASAAPLSWPSRGVKSGLSEGAKSAGSPTARMCHNSPVSVWPACSSAPISVVKPGSPGPAALYRWRSTTPRVSRR